MEAIFGQFFTAVIVGRMLGNIVTDKQDSGDNDA